MRKEVSGRQNKRKEEKKPPEELNRMEKRTLGILYITSYFPASLLLFCK